MLAVSGVQPGPQTHLGIFEPVKRVWCIGGAIGPDSTAGAVPLSGKVRQNKILPYRVLVKIIKHVSDLFVSV